MYAKSIGVEHVRECDKIRQNFDVIVQFQQSCWPPTCISSPLSLTLTLVGMLRNTGAASPKGGVSRCSAYQLSTARAKHPAT